jgi:hypothetical protein
MRQNKKYILGPRGGQDGETSHGLSNNQRGHLARDHNTMSARNRVIGFFVPARQGIYGWQNRFLGIDTWAP